MIDNYARLICAARNILDKAKSRDYRALPTYRSRVRSAIIGANSVATDTSPRERAKISPRQAYSGERGGGRCNADANEIGGGGELGARCRRASSLVSKLGGHPLLRLPQKLRQLGDIRRDPPRLVAR
jgi:hypothetical protein